MVCPHFFETFGDERDESGYSLCGRFTWDAEAEETCLGETLQVTPNGFSASPCDECLRVLAFRRVHRGAPESRGEQWIEMG